MNKAKVGAVKAAGRRNTVRHILGDWRFQVGLAVVLAAALIFAAVNASFGRALRAKGADALTVNGHTVSAAELNYYFRDSYDELMAAYGALIEQNGLIGDSAPLNEQQYSETDTWADVFYKTALDNALRTELICAAAQADGASLSQEGGQAVESQMDQLRQYARSGGYSDLTAFFRSFYGQMAAESDYKSYLLRRALADEYSGMVYDRPSYLAQELESYYASAYPEGGYDYDTADFELICIPFQADMSGADYVADEQSVESAKKSAEGLLERYELGEAAFLELAEQYSYTFSDDGGAYTAALKDDSQLEPAVAEWVFSPERQKYDTAVICSDYAAYVLRWSGWNIPAWQALSESELRREAWSEWYQSLEGAASTEVFDSVRDYLYYAP